MKRLLSGILVLVMLCSMTACRADDTVEKITDTAEETTDTTEMSADTAEDTVETADGTSGTADETDTTDEDAWNAKLEEYASVLIHIGLRVQEGDTVVIGSSVDQAAFARLCVSAAYDAGAAEVIMDWSDSYVTKERYLKADEAVLDTVPEYLKTLKNGYAQQGASYLTIRSTVPGVYDDVDSDRIARVNAAEAEAFSIRKQLVRTMEIPWCVAAVPNAAWAGEVFPDLEEEEAMDALWDAILQTVYVSGDGTAQETWQAHLDALESNAAKLNDRHFQYLHYTNSLGTDLTVELAPLSVWMSATSSTSEGKTFTANIPTMEAYTAPNKTGTNGVVYSSRPLCLNGAIITNIKFVIENGKIVSAEAETGEDVLKAALELDETACYLGEIALVPYDSPISNMGMLFYDTLFDENASCHIAFGSGYADCIAGGQSMTAEELAEAGLNNSAQHVDFMVGTEDLKIVGTTFDGEEIVIFENGNYAEGF